ncbi:MAG: glutamine-hydrolyzing carbamoyl-phosphate synthase small subunit [Bacillota bacterium]
MKKRMLVLENGKVMYGEGFGSDNTRIAEIVFNTSMVGYQEILSDPSYCGQIVVMSYPLIGNYGLADEDYEAKGVHMSGFIVREYNDFPSNFRYTKTLSEVMQEYHAAGISGIDTRQLVRMIRDEGSMKVMITDADRDIAECIAELKATTLATDQVKQVSCKKMWYSRTRNPQHTVVAIDCGIKLNIVRKLNQFGCNVIVVPHDTTAEDIARLKPDGLFLSNGPGDPESVTNVIEVVKSFVGKLPILGICLGHQIIGLAHGAKTYKMKFGHRGANHPVMDLRTGKVEITSQNHSFAIDKDSLENTALELTHVNLLDNEAEGMINKDANILSVQYHPESAAGPEDSEYIFTQFTKLMSSFGGRNNAKENRY